jgi:hypothetical protein
MIEFCTVHAPSFLPRPEFLSLPFLPFLNYVITGRQWSNLQMRTGCSTIRTCFLPLISGFIRFYQMCMFYGKFRCHCLPRILFTCLFLPSLFNCALIVLAQLAPLGLNWQGERWPPELFSPLPIRNNRGSQSYPHPFPLKKSKAGRTNRRGRRQGFWPPASSGGRSVAASGRGRPELNPSGRLCRWRRQSAGGVRGPAGGRGERGAGSNWSSTSSLPGEAAAGASPTMTAQGPVQTRRFTSAGIYSTGNNPVLHRQHVRVDDDTCGNTNSWARRRHLFGRCVSSVPASL